MVRGQQLGCFESEKPVAYPFQATGRWVFTAMQGEPVYGNNMFINLTAGSGLNYLDLTKGGDYIYPAMGEIEVGFGYRFGKVD